MAHIYILTHVNAYLATELARIKSTPTEAELATQIDEVESKVSVPCSSYPHTFTGTTRPSVSCKQVAKLREHLEPLRAGTPLVSTAELDALDAEWVKWRAEWVRRRKVFYKCAHFHFLSFSLSLSL
jgi:26S proteasome regulatory subunit, ATPase 3, interacting protein